MDKTALTILIRQLLAGELSADDQARLKAFVTDEVHRREFVEIVEELTDASTEEIPFREEVWMPVIRKVVQSDLPAPPPRVVKMKWVRYAAAIILLFGIGSYLYYVQKASHAKVAIRQPIHEDDIQPGTNGAVLTLADGSTIKLDSLGNGVIARQHGTEITLHNGQLDYTAPGQMDAQPHEQNNGQIRRQTFLNTVSTPAGRQFRLILPDGTKVWLNAASSLRYPVVFNEGERKVSVTGEAYFEVAKNEKKPFKVTINNATEVQVLGTNFNINAYSNEPVIKTTLIAGSIRLYNLKKNEGALLSPGDQAVVDSTFTMPVKKRRVEVERDIAWKDGLFSFTDADLHTVMRQLARWYNVKVDYQGGIPDMRFDGKIDKSLTLVQVLNGLTKKRVKYKIEGPDKITIYP
jgi:ferric-dicitrate binding protein FerR (iron transport regulator)